MAPWFLLVCLSINSQTMANCVSIDMPSDKSCENAASEIYQQQLGRTARSQRTGFKESRIFVDHQCVKR
jgi:hypothetical protein